MRELLPYLLILLTAIIFVLNAFAFMKLIPVYLTLPLLFISIYLTLLTFSRRFVYRRLR